MSESGILSGRGLMILDVLMAAAFGLSVIGFGSGFFVPCNK